MYCVPIKPNLFTSGLLQSWLTWADALVIQAVAEALNLTIHITESNPGFASVTNIGPVRSGD